ncbi:hypothetical protein Tco_1086268 [Tanacetum coccineum]
MKKVVEDVGEDEDFKRGSWVSATDYVNANGGIVSGCLGDIKNFLNNGKLDKVVAIIKSCSPNVIDDLTVTMKDLSAENLYAIAAENLYVMAITEKEKKKKFKVIAVRDKEAEKLNVYGFTKTFLREVKKEISKKFQ